MDNAIVKTAGMKLAKTFGQTGLKLRKHSPEIMVVGGIIGGVTAAVMACVATTKTRDIIEDAKGDLDVIHDNADSDKEYTDSEIRKDTALVYAKMSLRIAKLYAPSIAVGALSVASILGSTKILNNRNIALAAAYTAVDNGFKSYRDNVIERFGEAVDKELEYGIKSKKVTETFIDEETGKKKKVKSEIKYISPGHKYSPYARVFDETCVEWKDDANYNHTFLNTQQNYANDLLRAQGYLFLSDVYKMLGFKETPESRVLGWIYDPENNTDNDNYISFGIYDVHSEEKRDFINGYEKCIILDFNVDGPILNLI